MQPAQNLLNTYKQAEEYLEAGDLRKSADLCKQILDSDPRFAYGYHLMASLFRATGDYDKALEFAAQAIELSQQEPSFYMHQGQIYFALGKWKEAAVAFKKVSALDPMNMIAVLLTADSLSQQGEFDEAMTLFKRARAMQDIPEIDEHEGLCLVMKGDGAGAGLLFDRLIARRPDYEGGYIHNGQLALQNKHYEKAEAFFVRALAVSPDAQQAQLGLAAAREGSAMQ